MATVRTVQPEIEKALGAAVWKQLLGRYTPENAVKWLRSFVPTLDGQRPVDVMTEDGGLDRVLETLSGMSW